MMASVIRSSIIDIAKAIKAQLVAFAGFQPSQVFITSKRKIPHFVGEKDCILRIGGEHPDEPAIRADGRQNNQRYRTVTITIRTRQAVDRAGTDTKHLLNDDIGHLAVEDAVFNALEIFWPVDIAQNAITNCPIRLGPLTETESETQPEWLSSSVTVEIDYSRNLDQSRQ